MIPYIRCFVFAFGMLCLFVAPHRVNSQVLQESQSEAQIQKFAKYLYNLKLYDLAAEEYERLVYLNKSNPEHLKYLIRSYRGANDINKLKTRISRIELTDPDIINEYIYALMLESMNDEASQLSIEHGDKFSETQQNRIALDLSLASQDWDTSNARFSELGLAEKMKYEPLINQINNAKYKSPTKAAILSGIIPGSGRVYAKDNIDGIISLLFVASTAYQSYRRFNQKGTKSVAGWLYGGVSLGFYISNIYGSYQSAKIYNNNINKALHAKSLDIISLD